MFRNQNKNFLVVRYFGSSKKKNLFPKIPITNLNIKFSSFLIDFFTDFYYNNLSATELLPTRHLTRNRTPKIGTRSQSRKRYSPAQYPYRTRTCP